MHNLSRRVPTKTGEDDERERERWEETSKRDSTLTRFSNIFWGSTKAFKIPINQPTNGINKVKSFLMIHVSENSPTHQEARWIRKFAESEQTQIKTGVPLSTKHTFFFSPSPL